MDESKGNGIDIHFTVHNTLYRIRRKDSRNLVLERQIPSGWTLLGYYNAYSLRFAILETVTDNMKGELLDLFREQNRLLSDIAKQIESAETDTLSMGLGEN